MLHTAQVVLLFTTLSSLLGTPDGETSKDSEFLPGPYTLENSEEAARAVLLCLLFPAYSAVPGLSCSAWGLELQHVNSVALGGIYSLNRDPAWAPWIGSTES